MSRIRYTPSQDDLNEIAQRLTVLTAYGFSAGHSAAFKDSAGVTHYQLEARKVQDEIFTRILRLGGGAR